MDSVSGNMFDLEVTLARPESKIDGLSQRFTPGERRLEVKLELLRVDLMEAFLRLTGTHNVPGAQILAEQSKTKGN